MHSVHLFLRYFNLLYLDFSFQSSFFFKEIIKKLKISLKEPLRMLENSILDLANKYQYSYVKLENDKFTLNINELSINIDKIENQVYLTSSISQCPQEKKEQLFTYLMKANLLGMGTGNGTIGLDINEKFLTLTYIIAYEEFDKTFKERIEDFVNYLLFWDKEIKNFR